jgi:1L-myo-inositol 1-phosphate cytidylyltransferase
MDALIIAAGFGSRLREVSESKPLTPIAGIPLLELGARQARAAGAKRVVVVTGHEAERIEAALPAIAQRAGLPVIAQRVADWSKPNGWSVMAGAAVIDGDYLLMMSDHIFSGPILKQLAQQGSADRGVTLAIDRRTDHPLIDPDDATWVQTGERGFIRAIGKTISHFDAVDCGAFLATPELALAIQAAIDAGQAGSLSEGMQRLADAGRAATMDIGEAWWLDVDDPRAYALAEAEAPLQLSEIYG